MLTKEKTLQMSKEKVKVEQQQREWESALSSKDREIENLKKQLDRTNEELKKIKQERKNEQMFTKEKTLEISREKVKVEQQQREWESALSSKDREIENLTKQLDRANEQLKRIKQEINNEQMLTKEKTLEMSKEKVKVEQQQREWESALSSKDREIANLTKQLDRINEREVKNTAAKENKEQLQSIIERLEKENSSLCMQLEKLNDRLIETEENLEHHKEEKISTEEQYWFIENKIKEKDTLIATLEERLKRSEAKLETLMVALEEERNKVLLTEDKRKKDDNVITSLQSRLEELRTGYNTIKTEKENTEKRCLDLSRDIKSKEKEIDNFKQQLDRFDELTKECKDLRRDKQNMDNKVLRMSKHIQEKEKEAECLAEKLARSEEKVVLLSNEIQNLQQTKKRGNEESMQKLQRENTSLKTELDRITTKAHEQISVLNKEIKNLQKPKGLDSDEGMKKLHRENTNLKSDLERVSSSLDQLRRDYTEVKREKDHALNRLSSVAGEKLRDNNPGIADLSDENRPINLGEKFSQLYDDQWTDAMENLEENLRFGETEGIQCLLSILKRIFDECIRISDDQFAQLKEITGTTNLPSDQLKKLKDLRKSTALQSVKNVKQRVNTVMASVFSKEKDACQSYIDRCTELCWLMSVQDPPVVIDFTAVRGQVVDDKMLRKFTKTGSKIDFLVWPMIRLHKNGPLLQKGVVQPL
ncbi:centrosomal protein of 63 kDa-like [Saccostrea echinata]|uniref:centrosomal protein of 63 kDa-like n=1 Tax=Saccostrea echinata TaxID=191078 RepID=UPI002A807CDB|nr:centrosomal protein of 63 kDa-like [Saccostrea echinata]